MTGTGRTSTRLPEDVVREQINRLALFSAVGAGLWTFGVLMDTVFVPLAGRPGQASPHWATVLIEVAGILVSLAMFAYVRWSSHSAPTKGHVALVYMVMNAAGVAGFNTLALVGITARTIDLSWVTVVILVSSVFSLAASGPLLAASLVAATMDPLGAMVPATSCTGSGDA